MAHCVRPEQSKPVGPVPAVAYGAPSLDRAAATAAAAPEEVATGVSVAAGMGAAPASPSAPSVCGPATPSTSRPCCCWKARTAARVCGP